MEKYEDFVEYDRPLPDIDFKKYWLRLKSGWKRILIWTVAAFVFGCLVAIGMPHKYRVVSKLAPELSNTAVSRLTSLSALTGMNANLLGSTDAVYPMVYPDILSSTPFLVDLFDVPVEFDRKKEHIDTTLYSYITEYNKAPWWGVVLSAPSNALNWFKGLFEKDGEVVEGIEAGVDPFNLTKEQGIVAKALSRSIESAVDKKTLSVTIAVTMNDALVAAQVSRAVNDNLKRYVTDYRTDKARKDLDYYQKLYDEAQEEYFSAQKKYSYFVDSHQGLVMQSSRVEQTRLQNEMNLKYQMYTSAAQQLQNGKAKVQQETPVFAEVYPPTVPQKSANSRKKVALAFAFLGFLMACVISLFKKTE